MAYYSDMSGYSDVQPPGQDPDMGSPPPRGGGYGGGQYGAGYDGSPAPGQGYGGGMDGSGPMDGSGYGQVIGGRRPVLDKRGIPIKDMRKADNIRHLRNMLDQMNFAVHDTADRFDKQQEELEYRAGAFGEQAGGGGAGQALPTNPYGDKDGPRQPEIDMDTLPIYIGAVLRKENSGGGFMTFRRWEERALAFSESACELVLVPSAERMGYELLRIHLTHAHSARVEELGRHSDARIKSIFTVIDENGHDEVQLATDTDAGADVWVYAINMVVERMQDVHRRWGQVEDERRRVEYAIIDSGGKLPIEGEGEGGEHGEGMQGEDGGQLDMDAVATTLALQHVAYGQGISEAERGVETEFTVEVRDDRGIPDPSSADPEVMEAFLDSDELQLPVPLEYLGNGSFMGQYTPSREGEYELHIKAYKRHIQGSPFLVTVNPAPTAPLHCLVEGAGTRLACVGKVNTFRITARNQFDELYGTGGDRWELEVHGPGRAYPVVDLGDGTYEVKYEVDLQHEELSRAEAETIPRLELHVNLIDPRYAHISIDEQRPYGRPLLGSPFEPIITLDQGGPGGSVWSRSSLTCGQLQELSQALSTGGPEALQKFIQDSGYSRYQRQVQAGPAAPGLPKQRPPPPPAPPSSGGADMGKGPPRAGEGTAPSGPGPEAEAEAARADAQAARQDRDDASALREEAMRLQAKVQEDREQLSAEREQLEADRAELARERKELQEQFERVRQLGRHLEEESTTIAQMAKTLDAQRKALAEAGAHVPGLPDDTHRRIASLQADAQQAAGGGLSQEALKDHDRTGAGPSKGGRPATVVGVPHAGAGGGKGSKSVYTDNEARSAAQAGENAERALEASEGQATGVFDPAVMALFEKHGEAVHGLFEYYSAGKGGVSLQQFARMMKDFHVVPTFTKSREVRVAFNAAANLHLGSSGGDEGDKKRRLPEPAFIEAMSRMAIIALSKPAFQHIYKTAAQKVEVMLEMWELADPSKLDDIKAKRRAAAAKKAAASGGGS